MSEVLYQSRIQINPEFLSYKKEWYLLCTRSNNEKMVASMLQDFGSSTNNRIRRISYRKEWKK